MMSIGRDSSLETKWAMFWAALAAQCVGETSMTGNRIAGELPGVVMQTWGAVWQYFEREARDERAYTADFERFDQRKPSRIEIYIAVK